MKETACQSLMIDAVRANGGAAHKLSNRFLVGVSDLLVKLPARPAMLLEVKLNKFSSLTDDGHGFMLDVTKLQDDFLRRYARAGMLCAVASFVQIGSDRRCLALALFKIDYTDKDCYCRGDHVRVGQHRLLGNNDGARHANIAMLLRNLE